MSRSRDAIASDAGYQPWQFASFNAPRAISPPTAADVERVQQQAREEGYAAGYREGRAVAESEAQRLRAVIDGVQGDLAALDQTVADELLGLALQIARRVVGEALRLKPELVLPVVRDAVRCLPEFEQPVRVVLNPSDAALVTAHCAGEIDAGGWQIVSDATIARGGCRLKSATTAIDATLPSRWESVLAALGQNDEWLAA